MYCAYLASGKVRGIEECLRLHSRACSITHCASRVLGHLEAVHTEYLPRTGLKILLVVEQDAGELTLLVRFQHAIRLTEGVRLLEVV